VVSQFAMILSVSVMDTFENQCQLSNKPQIPNIKRDGPQT
jgi:hypothetical protein